ncbi:MAG: cytochrome c [Flavobacteriaceae bacterium]|nr:cytochrome c [Flavobacteriaceae bacterium]
MNSKNIIIIAVLMILGSCTNDKQSDLEAIVCVDTFIYSDCIKTIIEENCTICHHSGSNAPGPFPLETYDQVRDAAENGNLLVRIQLPDGANGIMPQTGKMTQTKIDAILNWVNEGFLE